MTLDWTKPLVAVNDETGERRDVELVPTEDGPDEAGSYYTTVSFNIVFAIWNPDGSPWNIDNSPWRIENRKPPIEWPEGATPELWNRMADYIRANARNGYAAAIRIAADMPKSADPLLLEAREVAAKFHEDDGSDGAEFASLARAGERDNTESVQIALAALRKGTGK